VVVAAVPKHPVELVVQVVVELVVIHPRLGYLEL